MKEAKALKATMIINILLVMPACTAAVPITIPPTIPLVWPTLVGNLAPASLSSSIISSNSKASIIGGKGTNALDSLSGINRDCGMTS